MAEVRRVVERYIVDMACDACGDGHMRPTNAVLTTYPAQYPHTCDNCGSDAVYNTCYPHYADEVLAATGEHKGREWVRCPHCGKRQFPITPGAIIRGQMFRCRGSNCKKEFKVSI